MLRYALLRAARGVLTLLAISAIVFSLSRITGSPEDVLMAPDLSPVDRQAILDRWGLDEPVAAQYWSFLTNVVHGDFGTSFKYPSSSVMEVILARLPASLELGFAALVVTLLVGVPLGVLAAVRRGGWFDRAAKAVALFGQSVPEFWLAILLVWVLAVQLRMFPTSGSSGPGSMVLPVVVLSIFGIAALVRLFRSSMLEVLDSEFIKLARLKGLSPARVLGKHALKAAANAPLTFLGGIVVHLLAGSTVVEIVFSWPGVGLLAYEAANARDFPVVQALALFGAAAVVGMNLLVDLLYVYIDPRVRLGARMGA